MMLLSKVISMWCLRNQSQCDTVTNRPKNHTSHITQQTTTLLGQHITLPVKHGIAHDEVEPIEQTAHFVGHVSVLEAVVLVVADGQSLHEGGEVGEGQDGRPEEECAHSAGGVASLNLAQEHVGQGVVQDEVEVRGEVERDGDVVQAVRRHVVLRLGDRGKRG
jgi:hypothetical protein